MLTCCIVEFVLIGYILMYFRSRTFLKDEEDDYYGDVEPISKEEFMKGIAKRAIDMLP